MIRGTGDYLEEWQSDFDIGGTSTPHEHWLNSSNHMGFDITANRIEYILDYYLNSKGFNKNNSVIWITGHSRGGAVANIKTKKLSLFILCAVCSAISALITNSIETGGLDITRSFVILFFVVLHIGILIAAFALRLTNEIRNIIRIKSWENTKDILIVLGVIAVLILWVISIAEAFSTSTRF